jgi:hypothetical protein
MSFCIVLLLRYPRPTRAKLQARMLLFLRMCKGVGAELIVVLTMATVNFNVMYFNMFLHK